MPSPELLSQKPAITPNPKPKLAASRFFLFSTGKRADFNRAAKLHQQGPLSARQSFPQPAQIFIFFL
jgi:hypothetical protein